MNSGIFPKGWTCEAKIPLSAFYMTRGSAWKTTWKVNIARSYRDAGSFDFNCWIDGNGYRDLKNFKTIKGFPVRRAAEDVWVKSAVAKVSGPKDGKRVYGRQFNELGDYISAFNPERHPDKCVGGTATCFSYSGGDYPTFTEYIANAWCEFLRGAKTLYPYAYHDLGDRAALYEGTRYLFSSAEALESILLRGKRQTLAKTADYEAALWTMPDGERMFCVRNFKTDPQTVTVPGLSGTFFEFRGKRTFDLQTSTFNLQPLESLVATTKRRDAGLPTFAETQALVDRLEAERLGRSNQLLGRYLDVEFATSKAGNGARKIFDGTRDVLAWSDTWGKNKFYEMSFPKFVPEFSEMTIYGNNIEGTKVKVRTAGEWKELVPVKAEKGAYSLRYVFDRAYATVKIRLDFPQNKVELYEIELPGKPRAIQGSAAEANVKNLAGDVTRPLPGLYTLRLPDYDGEPKTDQLIIRNYNLALHIGDIVCSREPPENRVEFVETNGTWIVRVTLAAPCADMTCQILRDDGVGPRPFSADGRTSFDLKPVDGTGSVWAAAMPIPESGRVRDDKGRLPRPFVRATVLGGAIDRPLLTWLYRKSGTSN